MKWRFRCSITSSALVKIPSVSLIMSHQFINGEYFSIGLSLRESRETKITVSLIKFAEFTVPLHFAEYDPL